MKKNHKSYEVDKGTYFPLLETVIGELKESKPDHNISFVYINSIRAFYADKHMQGMQYLSDSDCLGFSAMFKVVILPKEVKKKVMVDR